MLEASWLGRRFEISRSWNTLLLVILAVFSSVFSSALLNAVPSVHAQGGLEYTLSKSGDVTLVPGGSGSTTIIATLTAGNPSNVTLVCDLASLPTQFTGTSCSFTPASITPHPRGNITRLTVTVPASATYSTFNVTLTAKSGSPAPIAPINFTLTVGAKIAVNPTSVGSLSYTKANHSIVTVEFNVTSSPPPSGLYVGFSYNFSVLLFQSLDLSGGVLGNDATVVSECVDGYGDKCVPVQSVDRQGVVSLALATSNGKNTTETPDGKLFSVTFSVVGTGFSALHFVHQQIRTAHYTHENQEPELLNSVGFDGYFTNIDCPSGSGNLCRPPIVSFVPPVRPVVSRPVSVNGTAVSQNPSGFIREYNWTWGSGQDTHSYNSPAGNSTKVEANATFVFPFLGEHQITLSAQDNYGARAYYTLSIDVIRVWVDFGIGSLLIDHLVGVFPGTPVHIVATAVNNGVNPDNSTLRISINNQNVAAQTVLNLGPEDESTISYDWNTAGVFPRAYRVQVDLDEVRNATTGQLLENDTAIINGRFVDANNVRVAFVQFIQPLPAGFGVFLGLDLPITLSLGIVVIAATVFGVGLVRKSRARGPEPL